MARLLKILRTLRTHPKKSIFFSALATYGLKRGKDSYEEEKLLAEYCREAAEYGEQTFSFSSTLRHITVLINPAADGGRCKARFDKYSAPLLHLAGIKVAVVRTEHQGQARELMGLMENTDGVVVAGGDGTLSEVLTGLLRRSDDAAGRLPLCVLPLGTSSGAGRALYRNTDSLVAVPPKLIMEATMAVVRQLLRPMDVMEVTPHALPDQEETPKPIYCASLLRWGAYRDAWERKDKYWYWAGLKKYITYVFSSYKDLTWSCDCDVEFTLPCSGCSRCHVKAVTSTNIAPPVAKTPAANKKWYQYLLPDMRTAARQQQPQKTKLEALQPDVDYSSIDNPHCGVLHATSVEGVCDLRVSGTNTTATQSLEPHQLALHTGISDTTTKEFISEGWRRTRTGEEGNDRELLVGGVTVTPRGVQNEEREFSLDGEGFDVRPVTIRARPRAVMIFAPPLCAG